MYASNPSIGGMLWTAAKAFRLMHGDPVCIRQLQAYFVSSQGCPALHVAQSLRMQMSLQVQGLFP